MGAVNFWAKDGVLEIEVHVMVGGVGVGECGGGRVWGDGGDRLFGMFIILYVLCGDLRGCSLWVHFQGVDLAQSIDLDIIRAWR